MSSEAIADYGLLSDCHSAALVSRDGSVEWLCYPRFDSPALFARILDEGAGHWTIHPLEEATTSRRYVDQSMVLETTFETSGGRVTLTDALATGPNAGGHDLGVAAPRALIRSVTCQAGEVELELDFRPRPEYGIVCPLIVPAPGGVVARGGGNVVALSSPVPLGLETGSARARFAVRAGDTISFALHHRSRWESPPTFYDHDEIAGLLRTTIEAWRTWSAAHQTYQGPYRELVHRSGTVLQALTFQPTGAIVAAPTTSLPEVVGGVRNWDYRYAWVRDASLTLEALWVAACPHEARSFFSWLAGTAAAALPGNLQIMFGVGGEHDLTERELPHLSGWRNSRPVRVGNGAWSQLQLDVVGELLSAARTLTDQLRELDAPERQLLVGAADTAATRWHEPDEGIWEVRGDRQHFLHSKLMCWLALDCALDLAPLLNAADRIDAWAASREQIRSTILTRGWRSDIGAFTQALDSDTLDTSALMIPLVGFLPPDDPRVLSTIRVIQTQLTDERGLVHRYRAPDGLPGNEGAFLPCTFWLAEAQALAGLHDQARATFERAASHANDLGLLSEEVDPTTGELLGNFPQAFTHIALVNAAWTIAQAE